MNNTMIQLLVLAGIAVFLVLKLRSVLGTREGFEKPPVPPSTERAAGAPNLTVVETGPDRDILDHAPEGSPSALALAAMKQAEPSFSLTTFLQGARGAYEMILMAFERGDLSQVRAFLGPEVAETFAEAIAAREAQGLTVEANFVGLREMSFVEAEFDPATREGEVTVRFGGELTSVIRNTAGEVVEGSASEIKRQRDVWTFARMMGSADPNWQLVATGE